MYASKYSSNASTKNKQSAKPKEEDSLTRHIPQVASSLFFQHNEALGPPYHVLVGTYSKRFLISRHQFHQFQYSKQTRARSSHDGLSLCQVYPFPISHQSRHSLHQRLCDGRIGKIGRQVPDCTQVGFFWMIFNHKCGSGSPV